MILTLTVETSLSHCLAACRILSFALSTTSKPASGEELSATLVMSTPAACTVPCIFASHGLGTIWYFEEKNDIFRAHPAKELSTRSSHTDIVCPEHIAVSRTHEHTVSRTHRGQIIVLWDSQFQHHNY